MSRWYWFIQNLLTVFRNLFIKEPECRYWLLREDRLEHYQKVDKELVRANAERELWFNICQLKQQKLESAIEFINTNWRAQNEK